MKVLLTGATGYLGKRLLPVLTSMGHELVCCVRDISRFTIPPGAENKVRVIETDFLDPETLHHIPDDIDVAYYLIHSMSTSTSSFESLESQSALNFRERINRTDVQQVIYLSGISNEEQLSKHLTSRKKVEGILGDGKYHLTTFRAGIVVGSGSASFEIIRDLVEKLPVMVAPKWLNTRSQPIAIRDVIKYLTGSLLLEETYGNSYDIGGPEVLSYKEMLMQYAEVRQLKRTIITLPVMTPRLSSYWLYFVTATSYPLAVNLVDSMKVEVIARPNNLAHKLGIKPITYREAIRDAFTRIEQNLIISSWKDSFSSGVIQEGIDQFISVPTHGCIIDVRKLKLRHPERVLQKIWSIGGKNGWYYGDWLWEIRGFIDKMAGGVGLRRGRRDPENLNPGDPLDFWRVLVADKPGRRLLLYAEMKLPGEAWLEITIDKHDVLHQVATFRPRGLLGRLYWYVLFPAHFFVFRGLIKNLAR